MHGLVTVENDTQKGAPLTKTFASTWDMFPLAKRKHLLCPGAVDGVSPGIKPGTSRILTQGVTLSENHTARPQNRVVLMLVERLGLVC